MQAKYTYDEAYKATLEYFNSDELAAKVCVDKYLLRDNENNFRELTPDDMHWRIAKEFARIEKDKFKKPYTAEVIYSYLKDFEKIIPQGGPMYGIGNNYQTVSLSNCFVLNSVVDSYGGILKTDQEIVQISKRRGGVGWDISNIRPVGLPTNNSSRTTTGIKPFMIRFSNTVREVGQAGRRGASLQCINAHHPEIETFITIKNDNVTVTGSNISVKATDEFMQAVIGDKEYELRWPIDSVPTVSKLVSAKKMFNKLCDNAWLRADPGLLFWDTILKESLPSCYKEFGYEDIACNPCLPPWSIVKTKDGLRELKDIEAGTEIWSSEGWTKVVKKWSTGINTVYQYKTTGGTFYSTNNHRILSDGEKVEIQYADSIDTLVGDLYHLNDNIDLQSVMDGLVIGDGSVHKASNNLVYLNIGKDDQDYFTDNIHIYIGRHRPGIKEYAYEVTTHIEHGELPKTFQRSIPERYLFGEQSVVRGFLRGLYSANGSIVNGRITLKAASFKIIEQVQLMLSSIGIQSYYTTNKANVVEFENGTYECKQSYDLNISSDRDKFARLIGFIQKYKTEKLNKALDKSGRKKITFDFTEVREYSVVETFDITVDNNSHTFWCNGFNISNCGELIMCADDACRLLLLMLLGFVKQPFTKEAYFDFKEFKKAAYVAQRLMDDLVDLELEKIDKIIEKVELDPEYDNIKATELDLWKRIRIKCANARRTGLGQTALADTFAALGIGYGTPESIKLTDEIYKTMKLASYRASVDMAKEIGPFPVWDHELEKNNPFLLRIKEEDPELWKDMKAHGRRNIANLTTSPAGTVSILAGPRKYVQTTSAIEPAMFLSFTRKKKGNASEDHFRVDFTDDSGDTWQLFDVVHPKLKMWTDITGETDITKSPWHGYCAEDIHWKNRIDLQAAAQKHVDHSISSTLNLPKDISKEEVRELYLYAYEAGLKGVTIYRKGSRDGVITEKEQNKIKRPKELPCDIYKISVKGNHYFVVVGLLDGKPYEIFAGKNGIEVHGKHGTVNKIKRKTYQLLVNGEEAIDSLSKYSNEDEEALTRMLSVSLRHGVDLKYVVHQLEKVSGDMTCFAKSIVRALKKYIPDGTEVTGEECPNCNNNELCREGGCITCKNCGWSKC